MVKERLGMSDLSSNRQKILVYGGNQDEYSPVVDKLGAHKNAHERFVLTFFDDFPQYMREIGSYLACNVIVDFDGDEAHWRNANLALVETCRLLQWVHPFVRKNLIAATGTAQHLDGEEIVNMFGWGIDLFLKKPIAPEIFAAQFRATIRTLRRPGYRVVTSGDLTIDYEACRAWRWRGGNVYEGITLTLEEYRLLMLFLNNGEINPDEIFWPKKGISIQGLAPVCESLNKKTGRSFKLS